MWSTHGGRVNDDYNGESTYHGSRAQPHLRSRARTSSSSCHVAGRSSACRAKKNVKIITIAHPKLRHSCTVVSISANEIICGHSGHTMTFRAEDVAAVIEPGEHSHWYLYFAGSLAAAGAATWGTVVLAAVCPICAAATGVAALFLYVITPGTAFLSDDDSADSLLYLAPGQTLKVGLG
jgi:hypothetical protein